MSRALAPLLFLFFASMANVCGAAPPSTDGYTVTRNVACTTKIGLPVTVSDLVSPDKSVTVTQMTIAGVVYYVAEDVETPTFRQTLYYLDKKGGWLMVDGRTNLALGESAETLLFSAMSIAAKQPTDVLRAQFPCFPPAK